MHITRRLNHRWLRGCEAHGGKKAAAIRRCDLGATSYWNTNFSLEVPAAQKYHVGFGSIVVSENRDT
jgi:hypothetical protein